jgi:hypothetical protein
VSYAGLPSIVRETPDDGKQQQAERGEHGDYHHAPQVGHRN